MTLQVFDDFFQRAVDIECVADLFTVVDYVAPFFSFQVTYELPKVTRYKPKEAIESHYDDFLAYQTHNPGNLAFFNTGGHA
jgi:hypothetical protein